MARFRFFGFRQPERVAAEIIQAQLDPVIAGQRSQAEEQERQTQAAARADPILQALTAREQALIPGVRRRAFSGFAERGLGLSGLAEVGVSEALGELAFDFERQRQDAISQALRDVTQEQIGRRQLDLQERQLREQERANRPWWERI